MRAVVVHLVVVVAFRAGRRRGMRDVIGARS